MRPARIAEYILTSMVLWAVSFLMPSAAPVVLAKSLAKPFKALDPFQLFGGDEKSKSASAPAPAPAPAQPAAPPAPPETGLTALEAPRRPGLVSRDAFEATALTSPLGVGEDEEAVIPKRKRFLGA